MVYFRKYRYLRESGVKVPKTSRRRLKKRKNCSLKIKDSPKSEIFPENLFDQAFSDNESLISDSPLHTNRLDSTCENTNEAYEMDCSNQNSEDQTFNLALLILYYNAGLTQHSFKLLCEFLEIFHNSQSLAINIPDNFDNCFRNTGVQLNNSKFVKRWVCKYCDKIFNDVNNRLRNQCNICGLKLQMDYQLDIEDQLRNIFNANNLFDHKNNTTENDFIEDIIDGNIYQNILKNEREDFFTFLINTDGISLSEKSSLCIWPVFLTLNEVPLNKRFCLENVIVAESSKQTYPFIQNNPDGPKRDALSYKRDLLFSLENTIKHNGIKGPCAFDGLKYFHPLLNTNIDGMHSIFLGVVKSLFTYWFDSTCDKEYSLKNKMVLIQQRLSKIRPPSHFKSPPRSINDWRLWRASEFVYFILNYSLIVFSKIMKIEYLNNLVLFVIFLEIIYDIKISKPQLLKARLVIFDFVSQLSALYDPLILKSGFHELLHLVECTLQFGPINATNCYQFEELNRKITRIVKGKNLIGEEFIKIFSVWQEISSKPVIKGNCNSAFSVFINEKAGLRTSNNKKNLIHNGIVQMGRSKSELSSSSAKSRSLSSSLCSEGKESEKCLMLSSKRTKIDHNFKNGCKNQVSSSITVQKLSDTNFADKFALIQWETDRMFYIVDVKKIKINNISNINEGNIYDIKYGSSFLKASVKLIGTKSDCEKQLKVLRSYNLEDLKSIKRKKNHCQDQHSHSSNQSQDILIVKQKNKFLESRLKETDEALKSEKSKNHDLIIELKEMKATIEALRNTFDDKKLIKIKELSINFLKSFSSFEEICQIGFYSSEQKNSIHILSSNYKNVSISNELKIQLDSLIENSKSASECYRKLISQLACEARREMKKLGFSIEPIKSENKTIGYSVKDKNGSVPSSLQGVPIIKPSDREEEFCTSTDEES
ncbi:hypothetical protein BpHYR1_052467 [Brachionus plicatilis]|uniref:Uncharacterized protein n=1 Tax=Brachionus plicatilis TaxID=10195 RepID=A0A3M7QPQ4_BRAPC|nr:hypothetical protein BpHYR1_052467 [Brachionus plicatilis]